MEKDAVLVPSGKYGVPCHDGHLPEPVPLPDGIHQQEGGFYQAHLQVEEIHIPFHGSPLKMDNTGKAAGTEAVFHQKIPPIVRLIKALILNKIG